LGVPSCASAVELFCGNGSLTVVVSGSLAGLSVQENKTQAKVVVKKSVVQYDRMFFIFNFRLFLVMLR
jgi:hypothetical protein